MRVFALSDLHVDYPDNARWLRSLSAQDYREDLLILAGDLTHRRPLLAWCLGEFVRHFATVLFVPGNHDLWVVGEAAPKTSLDKFAEVAATAFECGVSMKPHLAGRTWFAPLLGWYDYSFGEPGEELRRSWSDFVACRWPPGYEPAQVCAHFLSMNALEVPRGVERVISFSHFLPRIDLVPPYVPARHRMLDPVLGSAGLDAQLRRLGSGLHVYGHSHINRSVRIDGVDYVNNAFGYPNEDAIAAKRLLCIGEV
ncbi:metallophosphoesterase [Lysobacter enzymogenes]|uniref:metallophosphoesterase n=1 Tax=Lysobacter enzymogenes TaxID=69 RepID=UPI00384E1940